MTDNQESKSNRFQHENQQVIQNFKRKKPVKPHHHALGSIQSGNPPTIRSQQQCEEMCLKLERIGQRDPRKATEMMNNMINEKLANIRKFDKEKKLKREKRRIDQVIKNNQRLNKKEYTSEKLRKKIFREGIEGQLREKERKKEIDKRVRREEAKMERKRADMSRQKELKRRERDLEKKRKYMGDIKRQLRERARSVGGVDDMEQYSGNF